MHLADYVQGKFVTNGSSDSLSSVFDTKTGNFSSSFTLSWNNTNEYGKYVNEVNFEIDFLKNGSLVGFLVEYNQFSYIYENGDYTEETLVEFKVNILDKTYKLNSVSLDSGDSLSLEDGIYSFVMPSKDVTIITSATKIEGESANSISINEFSSSLLDLVNYDEGVNSQKYSISQTDNYSAIDIETHQEGTITRYIDFYEDKFSQTYDEGTISGVRQRGTTTYQDQEAFYQITDYEDDDANDSVAYSLYSENLEDFVFGVGFIHYYYYNFYTLFSSIASAYSDAILVSNINDLEFKDNGIITLYSTIFVGDQNNADIEFTREDIITIENKVITKAFSTQLYGLIGKTNYNYSEIKYEFSLGEIEEYSGTKLDPSDYQVQ